MHLSEAEWLLWGGIAAISSSVVLAAICITVFIFTGKRLKKILEKEYGKPQK